MIKRRNLAQITHQIQESINWTLKKEYNECETNWMLIPRNMTIKWFYSIVKEIIFIFDVNNQVTEN